nr:zona pellucida sperm-binding protein 3-like [Anolis sagrei ordinatus]
MGFSCGLQVFFFLLLVLSGADPFNPWDISQEDFSWGSFPRDVPPPEQVYGPSLARASPWAWVDVSQPRALSSLKPVTVQCGEAEVVVTVSRDLFGTGKLIQATDLTLGSLGCQPTSIDASEDTVIFDIGLHECGSTLQMTSDFLVYSITLYYRPNLGNRPVIIRTSSAEVPIECHYPRKDNVSSKAIRPTWIPFSSTISSEQKLAFSLQLMNGDWSAERTSNRYQLGEAMHIQANVKTDNHVALRLFVDHCVATLSPDITSAPRYTIVDYNGCLVDGRSDASSSAFVSPRPRADSLQFTMDAFMFAGDARDAIYITCHLKVTAADQAPDALNKACSFNRASNRWLPVEGASDVCGCCEAGNCGLPQGQYGMSQAWWVGAGGRVQRDVSSVDDDPPAEKIEADVVLGPVILDDPKTLLPHPEAQGRMALMAKGIRAKFVFIMLGLAIATTLLALASVTLVLVLVCKKSRTQLNCDLS